MRVAALFVLALAAAAGPPVRLVEVPGLDRQLQEGSRSLRDVFPYLEGVRPDTWKHPADPLAAVRLFVAGPLVRSKAQADRIVEAGRKLQKELEFFEVEVGEPAVRSYEPTVERLRSGDHRVSLLAFEMDGVLQFVRVVARVGEKGITIRRAPIVKGPPTSWQTSGDVDASLQQAMRDEVETARKAFYAALQPKRDLDTFWAASRVFSTFEEYTGLFGGWDETLPTGVLRVAYRLEDGTQILLEQSAADPRRVGAATHYDADRKKLLHRLRQ